MTPAQESSRERGQGSWESSVSSQSWKKSPTQSNLLAAWKVRTWRVGYETEKAAPGEALRSCEGRSL